MENSKIVQILETFNPKEIIDLRDFANSRYCNPNKQAGALLSVLLDLFPGFEKNKLKKEIIFKKAFPKRAFDAAYFRKQSSLVMQILRNFLILRNSGISEFEADYALLRQYQERKLDNLFELHLKKMKGKRDDELRGSANHFYEEYLLAEEADKKFGRLQVRKFDVALQEKVNNLDAFYFINKLKSSCEIVNRQGIVEGTYQIKFIDKLLELLEEDQSLMDIPAVKIYLFIYKTLTDRANQTHFEKLKNYLNKYQSYFSKEEAVGMYRYAQNYCIRKINEGHQHYFQELFDLYINLLENGVNMPEGILSSDDYKNIVTVGLRLGKNEWVKDFIYNYKVHLALDQRENVFNYNLAIYYYRTKHYSKAIQLLNTVKFSDIFYEVSGKLILIKTYFQESEFQALEYLADAFKLNLRRNRKLAVDYKQGIINFLIQTKKVAKLKEMKAFLREEEYQKRIKKVISRIQEVDPIIDRNWLLNEVDSLNK